MTDVDPATARPRGNRQTPTLTPRGLTEQARADWAALARPTATPERFDPASSAGLPEPVRRWLGHAIAPGTPLRTGVELQMRGEIQLGAWRRFSAVQRLTPGGGFVWAATARLLGGPVSTTTFGVTVHARAADVWSWLVQIGQARGGMYSYEWLENLFGLDIHNAAEIRPEWQRLAVGDQVRVVPPGKLGMPDGYAFRVALIDPPHALVLRQQPPEHPWDATWAFLVEARGNGRCRLLARSRSARVSGLGGAGARVAEELMRPVVLLMTRKMLLGIKDRAERRAPPAPRPSGDGVDLYWLPLGAGGRFVRSNGRLYEALAARLQHRDRGDLYHAALEVHVGGDRYVIEQAPVWNMKDPDRGVVCEGPVGAPWLGRFKLFRYEVRRWRNGIIPDRGEAIDSPRRVSSDPARAQQLLELVPRFPTATWGRDEQHTGEMWNSNSLIAWLLARTEHDVDVISPPAYGRAPGWFAGLSVAAREADLMPNHRCPAPAARAQQRPGTAPRSSQRRHLRRAAEIRPLAKARRQQQLLLAVTRDEVLRRLSM